MLWFMIYNLFAYLRTIVSILFRSFYLWVRSDLDFLNSLLCIKRVNSTTIIKSKYTKIFVLFIYCVLNTGFTEKRRWHRLIVIRTVYFYFYVACNNVTLVSPFLNYFGVFCYPLPPTTNKHTHTKTFGITWPSIIRNFFPMADNASSGIGSMASMFLLHWMNFWLRLPVG